MASEAILLSVKPRHAGSILVHETKGWEYRVLTPDREPPYRVLVYATAPTSAIVGEFTAAEERSAAVETLIAETIDETPHDADEVRGYFERYKRGKALRIRDPERYDVPIDLEALRAAGYEAPQNFRYVDPDAIEGVPPRLVADGGEPIDDTDRVMVDIETLGTERGAAILSIGAVRFGPGYVGEEFYQSVDLSSCQDAGLSIDATTLKWWLSEGEEARHALTGGEDLNRVLYDFEGFYGDADEIWTFSPSFDCEILEAAFAAVDRIEPWSYRDERDCRTLASLPIAADIEQDGEEHDALDDAIYQARMVSETLERLNDLPQSGDAAHRINKDGYLLCPTQNERVPSSDIDDGDCPVCGEGLAWGGDS